MSRSRSGTWPFPAHFSFASLDEEHHGAQYRLRPVPFQRNPGVARNIQSDYRHKLVGWHSRNSGGIGSNALGSAQYQQQHANQHSRAQVVEHARDKGRSVVACLRDHAIVSRQHRTK